MPSRPFVIASTLVILVSAFAAGTAAAAPKGPHGGGGGGHGGGPHIGAGGPHMGGGPRGGGPHFGGGPRMAAPRMAAPRATHAPRMAAPRTARAPRMGAPHAPRAAHMAAPRSRNLATTSRAARRQNQQIGRAAQRAQRQQQRAAARATQRAAAASRTAQRLERLQARQAQRGRLTRSKQRQLQHLQRQQAREQRQPGGAHPQPIAALQQARGGGPGVSPQRALAGRFAAPFRGNTQRVADAVPAREAWRHHRRAAYVPWFGAVYWPYAYADVFEYTFWPAGYEPGFWAYAYDDFIDGIYFPDGAPYVERVYAGPYAAETTGSRRASANVPGQVSKAARDLCSEPASGLTAWPFARIRESVQPNPEQDALLTDLKNAAQEAADRFKAACPSNTPLTPPGRLAAMTARLQAMLDAIKIVRPPLEKFYASLSDEQKARFNAIGPSPEETAAANAAPTGQEGCGGDKAGLTALPVERIESAVRPDATQSQALQALAHAMDEAVAQLKSACPDEVPATPVGRLAAMQARLEAMIAAANIVQPALETFYAGLSNEQKAKFNRLGRA